MEGSALRLGHGTQTPVDNLAAQQLQRQRAFYFKKRTDRIDWRLVSSLDVTRVIREVDVASLQQVLENLTFCDIQLEDFRTANDPNLTKLFVLAQLVIEYLLYSQDILSLTKSNLEDQVFNLSQKVESLSKAKTEFDAEILSLKKENRNLRKTVYAYQLMAKMPGNALNVGNENIAEAHKCGYCSKIFQTEAYLESHLIRRHPGMPMDFGAKAGVQHEQAKPEPVVLKLTETIEKLTNRIVDMEKLTETQFHEKLNKELEAYKKNVDQQYQQEREKYNQEIKLISEKFNSEMERYKSHQKESNEKKSSIGNQLEDVQTQLQEIQKSAVSSLKEIFKSEMHEIKETIKQKEQQQIDKLEQEREKIAEYLEASKNQLENLTKIAKPVVMDHQQNEAEEKTRTEKISIEVKEEIMQENQRSAPSSPLKDKNYRERKVSQGQVRERHSLSYKTQPEENQPQDKEWTECLEILEGYKCKNDHCIISTIDNPLQYAPWIRTKFPHPEAAVIHQKEVITALLDNILLERGITVEAMRNEEIIEAKMKDLRDDRINVSEEYPFFLWMRDFMASNLEEICEQEFVYDKALELKNPPSPKKSHVPSFGILDFASSTRQNSRKASIRSDNYSKSLKPQPPIQRRPNSISNRSFAARRFTGSSNRDRTTSLVSDYNNRGYWEEEEISQSSEEEEFEEDENAQDEEEEEDYRTGRLRSPIRQARVSMRSRSSYSDSGSRGPASFFKNAFQKASGLFKKKRLTDEEIYEEEMLRELEERQNLQRLRANSAPHRKSNSSHGKKLKLNTRVVTLDKSMISSPRAVSSTRKVSGRTRVKSPEEKPRSPLREERSFSLSDLSELSDAEQEKKQDDTEKKKASVKKGNNPQVKKLEIKKVETVTTEKKTKSSGRGDGAASSPTRSIKDDQDEYEREVHENYKMKKQGQYEEIKLSKKNKEGPSKPEKVEKEAKAETKTLDSENLDELIMEFASDDD